VYVWRGNNVCMIGAYGTDCKAARCQIQASRKHYHAHYPRSQHTKCPTLGKYSTCTVPAQPAWDISVCIYRMLPNPRVVSPPEPPPPLALRGCCWYGIGGFTNFMWCLGMLSVIMVWRYWLCRRAVEIRRRRRYENDGVVTGYMSGVTVHVEV